MTESESPLTLCHDATVAKMNRVIDCIHDARKHCHRDVRTALAGEVSDDTLEAVLMMIDGYAASLEGSFNVLIELKQIHPAAWDDSEAGRAAGAYEAEIAHVVTESLAKVFGLHSPGAPEVDSEHRQETGRATGH